VDKPLGASTKAMVDVLSLIRPTKVLYQTKVEPDWSGRPGRDQELNQTMNPMFYFWVALLAVLLFFPVSNIIWVTSVRRLQRKLGRQLATDELHGQKNRARFISLVLVTLFSWIFNLSIAGAPHG